MPEFTARIPVLRDVGERWKKGGGSGRLISILRDTGNREAFKLLVRTTTAMFALPLLVFLLAHNVVLEQLFTFKSPGDKGLWSGVCALATVQLVILGFLVSAFNETADDDSSDNSKQASGAAGKKDK